MTDPTLSPLPPVPLPISADIPQAMRERYDHPLPPERTVDPDRLAGSYREEEELQGDLPEETGE